MHKKVKLSSKVVELPKSANVRLNRAISLWNESTDNAKEALDEFINLINEGIPDAYFFAGLIYDDGGKDVDQDTEKALFYYKKSIEECGSIEAYLAIGRLYYSGIGVEKDYCTAFEYYSYADEHINNQIISMMLGRFYHFGLCVEKDIRKASEYYLEAIKHGNVFALRLFSKLEIEKGNYFSGVFLFIKSIFLAIKYTLKDMKDSRLRPY